MKIDIRKTIGITLIAFGVSGLLFSSYISYVGKKTNSELISQFEQSVQSETEKGDKKEFTGDESIQDDIIGILSIPSVNIKYAVCEGTDVDTLKKSLGHFEGTAYPGEVGNFAVAGHRNSSFDRYFNRLDEVVVGDKITITTREATYTYVVTDTFKVQKEEVDVLDPTDYSSITLVTCVNGYKPNGRIIVKGILLDE